MNFRERSILQEGKKKGFLLKDLKNFFINDDLYAPGKTLGIISKIDVKIEEVFYSLFIKTKIARNFFYMYLKEGDVTMDVKIIKIKNLQNPHFLVLNEKKAQIVYSMRNEQAKLVIN
jgi:hypothetical protein